MLKPIMNAIQSALGERMNQQLADVYRSAFLCILYGMTVTYNKEITSPAINEDNADKAKKNLKDKKN